MQDGNAKRADRKDGTRPKHNCDNCIIESINDFPPFPNRSSSLRLPVSVAATKTLTLKAIPDDPKCPCEWRNSFQIAGHRIATGATTLSRTSLNSGPSPLIETLRPRLDRLQPFFTIAGCTLTIKLQDLDSTLRQGIGLARIIVMIEMTLQVRCGRRWRNIRLIIDD